MIRDALAALKARRGRTLLAALGVSHVYLSPAWQARSILRLECTPLA